MALTKLHQQSESASALASEIGACAQYARELEDALRYARNVLTAIDLGELLTNCSADYDRHNAANGLLDFLALHLNEMAGKPRADLSTLLANVGKRLAA